MALTILRLLYNLAPDLPGELEVEARRAGDLLNEAGTGTE
jgi:hypothetical protein